MLSLQRSKLSRACESDALIAQAIYLVSKADLVKDVKCGDGVTVRVRTRRYVMPTLKWTAPISDRGCSF